VVFGVGGLIVLDGCPDDLIQATRRDTNSRLLVNRLCQVDDLLDVPGVFRGHKRHGGVPHGTELGRQIFIPFFRGHFLFAAQVPFINHEDTGFVVFLNLGDQLFVDLGNRLLRIKKH